MTKDELLNIASNENYSAVQAKLILAAQKGETSETFQLSGHSPLQGWEITELTISRLKEDGFTVEKFDNKFGYWDGGIKVSWN